MLHKLQTATTRTAAQVLVDQLAVNGVEHVFCVPGESFLGLLDGLRDAGIRIVTTRHEGGAAFMAEAHGQLTGRPSICVATRAVGAANGRNPISIIVPCHRVVGASGALTGFAGGLDVKAWLLDHERFGNA